MTRRTFGANSNRTLLVASTLVAGAVGAAGSALAVSSFSASGTSASAMTLTSDKSESHQDAKVGDAPSDVQQPLAGPGAGSQADKCLRLNKKSIRTLAAAVAKDKGGSPDVPLRTLTVVTCKQVKGHPTPAPSSSPVPKPSTPAPVTTTTPPAPVPAPTRTTTKPAPVPSKTTTKPAPVPTPKVTSTAS